MAAHPNRIVNDLRVVFLREPHDSGYEVYRTYRTAAGLRTGLRFVKMRHAPSTHVLVVEIVAGKALRAAVKERRFRARAIDQRTGEVK